MDFLSRVSGRYNRAVRVAMSVLIISVQYFLPISFLFSSKAYAGEVCPEGSGWVKIGVVNDGDPVTYNAGDGHVITEVCVKGGQNMYHFTEDGDNTDFCWRVVGIGTSSSTASNISADGDCHDISHASFLVEDVVQTGDITIVKNTVPSGDQTSFEFIGDFSFFLYGDGDSQTFSDLLPGTYNVHELLSEEWYVENIVCTGDTDDESVINSSVDIDIDLDLGEDITCTFVNTRYGSISGVKWEDMDGDGVGNCGEPGIPGWGIVLKDEFGNVIGEPISTVEGGLFSITGVRPGNYQVCEEDRSGWYRSYPEVSFCQDVTVLPGQNTPHINFGNYRSGMIQGRKYEDLDLDGLHDIGVEERLNGWTIRLYNEDWGLRGEVVTGHTGKIGQYKFDNLPFGTYYISEVKEDGWYQSGLEEPTADSFVVPNESDAIDEADLSWKVVIGRSGQEVKGRKFGNVEYAEVIIHKDVVDWDGGDIFDDSQIFGVTLGGDSTGSVNVQGEGLNYFLNLIPGSYNISETYIPPGYEFVSINTNPSEWLNFDLVSGQSFEINIENRQLPSTIRAVKYEDLNINGTNDGEPRIEDWEMKLYKEFGCSGELVNALDTDSNGVAKFTNLEPGEYSIFEEDRDGWIDTSNVCKNVTIGPGETRTRTFGNYELGMIQGRKYEDLDLDRLHDVGVEERLNGWTIRIYNDDWTIRDEMLTGDTGNIGQYRFDNLPAGTYYVSEMKEDGWYQSGLEAPTADSFVVPNESDAIDEADLSWKVVIGRSGQEVKGRKFGNVEYGKVSGYKFNDVNGNGEWDEGESPLPGWQICLDPVVEWVPSDNGLPHKVGGPIKGNCEVTDINGYYEFTGVRSGDSRLHEIPQDGWDQILPEDESYEFTVISGFDERFDFGNRLITSDLQIEKIDDEVEPFKPGERVTYTLTVTNNGPYMAENVVVTDTLPADVTYVNGLAENGGTCSHSNGVVTCLLGDINVGDEFDVVIEVDISLLFTGELENITVVDSDTPDEDPDNNEDNEFTLVEEEGEVLGVEDDPEPEVLAATGQDIRFWVSLGLLGMLMSTFLHLELKKKE